MPCLNVADVYPENSRNCEEDLLRLIALHVCVSLKKVFRPLIQKTRGRVFQTMHLLCIHQEPEGLKWVPLVLCLQEAMEGTPQPGHTTKCKCSAANCIH